MIKLILFSKEENIFLTLLKVKPESLGWKLLPENEILILYMLTR